MATKPADRLKDKVAIVTGAASGIGAATATLFAKEGAKVIVADINQQGGAQVVESIRSAGGIADFVRADVSKHADIRAMIEFAVKTYGGLDVLVNNAGLEITKNEVDTTEEEWDRVFDVNVKGVFLATKYAVPEMKKRGGGSIVNISSAYGIVASNGFAAYHASKAAVRHLTKATALAHIKEGIRANVICPGVIDTPMLQAAYKNAMDPVAMEEIFLRGQPIGRAGRPEELAYGCLFLASDESSFCVGADLSIDGGFVAQ